MIWSQAPVRGWAGIDVTMDEAQPGPGAKIMIELLRRRERAVFETMLAHAARIDPPMVRRALKEPVGQALAVVCRVAKIEKSDFASLFFLSADPPPAPTVMERALAYFDRMDPETARRTLNDWQFAARPPR